MFTKSDGGFQRGTVPRAELHQHRATMENTTPNTDMDVAVYGFKSELREFCKAMKRTTIVSDPNYRQFLADLHTRQAPGFLTLERILHDIIPA